MKANTYRLGIDEYHIIQAAKPTDRFINNDEVVDDLLDQITDEVEHFSADGAYDETPVYDKLLTHSPKASVVIPPAKKAVVERGANEMRNRNVYEIKANGRMAWQKYHNWRTMHARKMPYQKQEFMIGCGVLQQRHSP